MPDLETLAVQMRQAFASGVPVKMPLLRFRDLDILFELLAED
ncbi:hypothetical protein [Pseudorhodoferax soli]|uniref:Uncharacterized protein n=1 Tax=Pseudorhodoferax soli TaxID=545864 RepID=A0A368XWB2_9BURK|nr:hypothetical protein [Pseudorhodoferax soli]RCW71426.1 hypothetical protein DES41_104245 [Pseudorhodoferax soli]